MSAHTVWHLIVDEPANQELPQRRSSKWELSKGIRWAKSALSSPGSRSIWIKFSQVKCLANEPNCKRKVFYFQGKNVLADSGFKQKSAMAILLLYLTHDLNQLNPNRHLCSDKRIEWRVVWFDLMDTLPVQGSLHSFFAVVIVVRQQWPTGPWHSIPLHSALFASIE